MKVYILIESSGLDDEYKEDIHSVYFDINKCSDVFDELLSIEYIVEEYDNKVINDHSYKIIEKAIIE